MASYGDESVDSYIYSSYNPYAARFRHKPPPRDVAWKYKKVNFNSNYAADAEAFNDHQRAKLRAILSQINPKLTPRLRKANTRDVAVQVNPKTDASVQCAIGPRTLLSALRDALRSRKTRGGAAPGGPRVAAAPPGGTVRYPRTLAVYSPVAYRAITSFLSEDDDKGTSCDGGAGGEPLPEASEERRGVNKDETDDVIAEEPEAAARQEKTKSKQPLKPEASETAKELSKVKAQVRFQFLEQKYGYYHCKGCNLRWESAYVWCVQGTNKARLHTTSPSSPPPPHSPSSSPPLPPPSLPPNIYFSFQTCNKARCSCALTQRHVDPKRPHRQDLCGRCKGKGLSCDSTFSFKYII
ncbi:hypothetical protein NHX12_033899 [Muraenolepis orangiensis]|uniref:3CxxC-type domain-containing protein n=1 Tax=Muraenolepis orangiensis TaxID=630683 RepID=A0A9Q0E358_9TELE|nr:hypothetical protein NHX12_033899 [Muraenolepis orangiensis]